MYISKKWRTKAENYKWFASNYSNAMYDYESTGNGFVNHYDAVDGMVNGYALGKHLLDLQLAMWIEDMARPFMLTKYEFLTDPELIPIRQFLIDQFGEVEADEPTGKPSMNALNKFIGEYMY